MKPKKRAKLPYINPYTGEVSALACLLNGPMKWPRGMGNTKRAVKKISTNLRQGLETRSVLDPDRATVAPPR